jgi:hypothetical protein
MYPKYNKNLIIKECLNEKKKKQANSKNNKTPKSKIFLCKQCGQDNNKEYFIGKNK